MTDTRAGLDASADRNRADTPLVPAPEKLWRVLVGEQLREIRIGRGESLRGVAGRARVSPQYLSEIERGFKEPSSEILAAIGASLDTTLLELTSRVAERLHKSEGSSGPAFSSGPSGTPGSSGTCGMSGTTAAFALAA